MKVNALKSLIASSILTLSFSTIAGVGPHKVAINSYPYIGSLGDSAEALESELKEKAIEACGSFDNVARLENLVLSLRKSSTINTGINIKGIPGSKGSEAIFILGYPKITGSVNIYCEY